jgi:hypothetical protein
MKPDTFINPFGQPVEVEVEGGREEEEENKKGKAAHITIAMSQ